MLPGTIDQLNAIQNSPGTQTDKDRAKALLLSQLAVTTGLVVLSIKGSLPDLKGGPKIYVDTVNGVPVARLTATPGPVTTGGASTKWVKLADKVEVPAGSNAQLEKASKLKFSQENIGPTTGDGSLTIGELTETMRTKGWRGEPLQVVRMEDGSLVSLDNRRLTAAQNAGLKQVPVNIHSADAKLPKDWADAGFKLKKAIRRLDDGTLVVGGNKGTVVYPKGHVAQTYKEAVLVRTANQGKIKSGAGKGETFPLGGRTEKPRVRPPKPGPVRTGQADRTGQSYDAEFRKAGGGERLPDDVVEALTSGLPGANIDPANPLTGIAEYLAKELKIAPDSLKVKLLGGGKSGAQVYSVTHDDKTIGIFKIFRDKNEMLREVAALRRLAQLDLKTLSPVGMASLGKTAGGKQGVGLMDAAQGAFVAKTLEDAGSAAGSARASALSKLENDVKQVAKGLGELAEATKSGSASDAVKKNDIFWLDDRWKKMKALQGSSGDPVLPVADRRAIDGKLDSLYKEFQQADIPASIAHGDAHGGNFSVQGSGKVQTIDTETLYRSVGTDGKGKAPLGTDAGRFYEWLYTAGREAGLKASEIAKVQEAFLSAYKASSPTARVPGFDVAMKLYQVNLDTIALRGEMMDRSGKAIPSFDPNNSATLARLKKILGL